MADLWSYKTIDDTEVVIYNALAFEKLKHAGKLAQKTLQYIKPFVVEGVATEELDSLINQYIIKNNAKPATLGYRGYPKSSCISINHEVCHGIPSSKKLQNGDILNIDITVILDGFYGDCSDMFSIGKVHPKAQKLIDVTNQCLNEAIAVVKAGATLGDIGAIIQKIAHSNKFSVVEDFCGHGIGHAFHLPPNILHYGKPNTGLTLEEGMVFTIEPMINIGTKDTMILKNGWTAITRDLSLSAQVEHTIGVLKDGCVVFTQKE